MSNDQVYNQSQLDALLSLTKYACARYQHISQLIWQLDEETQASQEVHSLFLTTHSICKNCIYYLKHSSDLSFPLSPKHKYLIVDL